MISQAPRLTRRASPPTVVFVLCYLGLFALGMLW